MERIQKLTWKLENRGKTFIFILSWGAEHGGLGGGESFSIVLLSVADLRRWFSSSMALCSPSPTLNLPTPWPLWLWLWLLLWPWPPLRWPSPDFLLSPVWVVTWLRRRSLRKWPSGPCDGLSTSTLFSLSSARMTATTKIHESAACDTPWQCHVTLTVTKRENLHAKLAQQQF